MSLFSSQCVKMYQVSSLPHCALRIFRSTFTPRNNNCSHSYCPSALHLLFITHPRICSVDQRSIPSNCVQEKYTSVGVDFVQPFCKIRVSPSSSRILLNFLPLLWQRPCQNVGGPLKASKTSGLDQGILDKQSIWLVVHCHLCAAIQAVATDLTDLLKIRPTNP